MNELTLQTDEYFISSSDIPQVVILTKIDSICEQTKNNTSDAFFSPKVESCVAKVSRASFMQ